MKGVVKVELDILDRVEMGRQLNGEVRLYSANNKVPSVYGLSGYYGKKGIS